VASIVAVVLSGTGLLVAVLAFESGDGPGGDGPGGDCVVGRWRIVEQRQETASGILTLAGDGPTVEYRADGTGVTDFGDGVTYALEDTLLGGLGSGDTVVSGTVSHDYVTEDGTMRYLNIASAAVFTVELFGELPYEISDETFGFRCDGDTMTHDIEERYQARLQRLAS
jgi:hypothetical protein